MIQAEALCPQTAVASRGPGSHKIGVDAKYGPKESLQYFQGCANQLVSKACAVFDSEAGTACFQKAKQAKLADGSSHGLSGRAEAVGNLLMRQWQSKWLTVQVCAAFVGPMEQEFREPRSNCASKADRAKLPVDRFELPRKMGGDI